MKLPCSVTLLAILLSASSIAKPYSPAAFGHALRDKLGTKKDLGAANSAAGLLGKVLKDEQNTKHAVIYITRILTVLDPIVKDSLQARARFALVNQLTAGYFSKVRHDYNDPIFMAAVKKLLAYKIPASQKASAASAICQPIYDFFRGKGGSNVIVIYWLPVPDTFRDTSSPYTYFNDSRPLPTPPDS